MDTPLSALGEQQAVALGRWFGAHARRDAADRRAVLAVRARGRDRAPRARRGRHRRDALTFQRDERLREKEFGMLDRLTKLGIRQKYPELAEQRAHVGKFYFRPPGGESWCDVILRLRSVLDTITREYRRERVLIVAHQVTVNCFRYLLERMTEDADPRDRPRAPTSRTARSPPTSSIAAQVATASWCPASSTSSRR